MLLPPLHVRPEDLHRRLLRCVRDERSYGRIDRSRVRRVCELSSVLWPESVALDQIVRDLLGWNKSIVLL